MSWTSFFQIVALIIIIAIALGVVINTVGDQFKK